MAMPLLQRWLRRVLGDAPGAAGSRPLNGHHWDLPASAAGREEAAHWAYRTILLREPDSRGALEHLARSPDSRAMRDTLLRSAEARGQHAFPVAHSMTGDEPAQAVEVEAAPADQKVLFERVHQVWHALGEEQPHWSVVTAEEFRPANIAGSMEAFYASGEANVETLLKTLARNGINPKRIASCMDFGCGVGRLTAALAKRFASVVAVDVSASHLDAARKALGERGITNAVLHRLEAIEDVASLPKCDLVFSVIVLQHNPPPVMRALFAGLLDRVNPGGAAVIQVPTQLPAGYRFIVSEYLATGGQEMEMHALPQYEVFALVKAAGMEMHEVLDDAWIGFGPGSRSNTFVMRRR